MFWFKKESKEVARLENRIQELLVNQAQLLKQARARGRDIEVAKVEHIATLIFDLPLPHDVCARLCASLKEAIAKQYEEAPEFRR
jgi:hypothetical protein